MLPQTLSKDQFGTFVEYLMLNDNRLVAPVARGAFGRRGSSGIVM